MQAIFILPDFNAVEQSDEILEHINALHGLGVEIVVSAAGVGNVLADALDESYGIVPKRTYSDITVMEA